MALVASEAGQGTAGRIDKSVSFLVTCDRAPRINPWPEMTSETM